MNNKKRKKGIKVVIITFVILVLLVIGLFAGFYYIIKDANERGNMLDGSWSYNDATVMKMDINNGTYSLNVDGIKEEGKIVKVKLQKENADKSLLYYDVTLDGNGNHVVKMMVDYSSDKEGILSFSSEQYSNSYEFSQKYEDE